MFKRERREPVVLWNLLLVSFLPNGKYHKKHVGWTYKHLSLREKCRLFRWNFVKGEFDPKNRLVTSVIRFAPLPPIWRHFVEKKLSTPSFQKWLFCAIYVNNSSREMAIFSLSLTNRVLSYLKSDKKRNFLTLGGRQIGGSGLNRRTYVTIRFSGCSYLPVQNFMTKSTKSSMVQFEVFVPLFLGCDCGWVSAARCCARSERHRRVGARRFVCLPLFSFLLPRPIKIRAGNLGTILALSACRNPGIILP